MNNLEFTRGDRVGFNLSVEDYTFKVGDYLYFRIYNKKELNKEPLLNKKITIEEETDIVNITLSSEETKLGTMENKPVILWYEIELNGDTTIIGYDEEGAKEITLYPEGVE